VRVAFAAGKFKHLSICYVMFVILYQFAGVSLLLSQRICVVVILSLRNDHQYIFCREHSYVQIAFIFDPSVELILLLSNTVCLCICYLFSYVLYALVTFRRMFLVCVLFVLSVVHIKCVHEYYVPTNQTSPLLILTLHDRFWCSSRSAASMC
jgi:hypothetical protein